MARNNVVVEESSRLKMTFDGTYARMTISKAKVEMTGMYICTIVNKVGTAESRGELTVFGECDDDCQVMCWKLIVDFVLQARRRKR